MPSNTTTTTAAIALAALLAPAAPAWAQGEDAEQAPPAYMTYPDEPASMRGTVEIEGRAVHFEAEAGTIAISADEREPAARLFYISYTRLDAPNGKPLDPSTRPLTFSFNGGPGSSSVWLHLGIFGPYRVAYADDKGRPTPPPHGLVENEASLLDVSDFVFIDPVSTGFSRTEEDVRPGDYHGVEADIASVGSFIQQYLSRRGRWGSPKFVAGESYGTTRAAGLADHLWGRHGIGLNGVMLISMVTNFQTIRFNSGNDMPHVLYLPNFAATAHYHGALDEDLLAMPVDDLVDEVHAFATGDYATYLLRGADADAALRDSVRRRLARYTGLSEETIADMNLRPAMPGFCKALLRDRGVVVGRLDGRFLGKDEADFGGSYEYDPSYAAILGSYTAGLNELVRQRIGFETDLPYEILTGRVRPWSYSPTGNNAYVNTGERLRGTMQEQEHLRVYIAQGLYDLATPQAAAKYTIATTFADEGLRARIMTERYEAGHMMYIHAPSRAAQREHLVNFYEAAMTPAPTR